MRAIVVADRNRAGIGVVEEPAPGASEIDVPAPLSWRPFHLQACWTHRSTLETWVEKCLTILVISSQAAKSLPCG
jgi:hypothetical protein